MPPWAPDPGSSIHRAASSRLPSPGSPPQASASGWLSAISTALLPGSWAAGAEEARLPASPGPRGAPHLELGLGDLATLLHVQGGERVPDGLEQLLAQGHG